MYYEDAINGRKNNPKELWKFLNSVLPNKRPNSPYPTKLIVDETIFDDPVDISEQFNNYFVEIGQSIAKSANTSGDFDFKQFLHNAIPSTIVLEAPQPLEIYNAINSLNPHKACGYDNISSLFLRTGNEVLAPILFVYFAYVFEQGVFPQTIKKAKVIPIFKSGNKSFTSNYRPISLLPSLSKVLEKLIKNRLIKFFHKHNILYNYQYGFREKHSVLHALLDVTSLGYNAIQNKKHSAFIFMDLRKAFDTVSHKILLQKLYHYGIRGPAYRLIESYLNTRQQFVSINICNSSCKPIQIGVPQGSILGPLLFLVYINDLPNATSTKPRLFADDTCLVLSHSSPTLLEKDCNQEMQNLNIWCNANKLQINPQKSSVLTIPFKSNSPSLDLNTCYNDCLIACQISCKYLGVSLDSKLHFQPHINQIEIKVAKAVGI